MFDLDQVKKIAKLSKLDLEKEELQSFQSQLSDILSFVDKLNEVDTSNVEATSHAVDMNNVFRDDVAVDSKEKGEALAQSPSLEENQIVVPKVL